MTSAKRKKKEKIPCRALFRGILCGLITSAVLVLILTLFLYFGWLKESAIGIGNTVIKILSALIAGVSIGLGKHTGTWISGGAAALIAQLVAWTGMSLYLGAFSPTWNLFADLLMSFAIGAASAAFVLKLTRTS